MLTRIVLIGMFALMLAPVAVADKGMTVDRGTSFEGPTEDCPTCASFSAWYIERWHDNCADCPAWDIQSGWETDGQTTTFHAKACRTAFFYFCAVDETYTV